MCDDGRSADVRALVDSLGARRDARYVTGRQLAKGEMNGKSGNINSLLAQLYPPGVPVPSSEVIAVFDADQVSEASRGGWMCKWACVGMVGVGMGYGVSTHGASVTPDPCRHARPLLPHSHAGVRPAVLPAHAAADGRRPRRRYGAHATGLLQRRPGRGHLQPRKRAVLALHAGAHARKGGQLVFQGWLCKLWLCKLYASVCSLDAMHSPLSAPQP